MFGCASPKAARQFTSSALEESELASLGLSGPICTLGLAASHRGLQPSAEPLSPENCYRSSLRRALLGDTRQLPRTAYCWARQNDYAPFAHFYLTTAAAARWVLDVAASPGQDSWAVTSLLLAPLSPILSPILFLWKSKCHFAYGSGSELCSAAWRGRHVAKCSGIYCPAFPWVWSSCFPGNFLRPASTDVLIFHNYGRCQWKVLSSTATAGALQPAEQGMWHLNKTSCCVTCLEYSSIVWKRWSRVTHRYSKFIS